jgi:hypothetical protein
MAICVQLSLVTLAAVGCAILRSFATVVCTASYLPFTDYICLLEVM